MPLFRSRLNGVNNVQVVPRIQRVLVVNGVLDRTTVTHTIYRQGSDEGCTAVR